MNFKYYKTNLGLLLTCGFANFPAELAFNDEKIKPVKTWSDKWVLLPCDSIETVYRPRPKVPLGYKWELGSDFAHLDLPKTLSDEEIGYDADEYELNKQGAYYGYSSMYNRVITGYRPASWAAVEHTTTLVSKIEITMPESPAEFSYKVVKGSVSSKSLYSSMGEVKPDMLSTVFSPEVFWHTKPCYITAATFYNIVRGFIQENIDSRVAKITSDFDFCLSVSKRLKIKPWVEKIEHKKSNGRSYAKPKFSERVISEKLVEVFECAPKTYQKYTTLSSVVGNNLKDLQDRIDSYLADLIAVINSKVEECECCHGSGYEVKSASHYANS